MAVKITRVAAHGLLKKGSKFLITKRSLSDSYMPGYWDLPGGTVNFGEKIITALNREFYEETSLKIKPGPVLYVHDYVSNKYRHQFQLVFECSLKSGKIKLNPRDHSEYKWVTKKEMGKLKKIKFLQELYKNYLK